MATSGSGAGSPSGSHPGSPGRKARSLALLLLFLCGAAGLALWATRPPSDVPTSALSSTPGPATPPSARPGDVPLAGSGRPPSSRPATTPDAATGGSDAPSTPSATEPPSAPLPRTPVRVIVREAGGPVADALVTLERVGDARSPSSDHVALGSGFRSRIAIDFSMTPPVADQLRHRFHRTPLEPVLLRTDGAGVAVTELPAGEYALRARRDDDDVASIGVADANVVGQAEVTIELELERATRVEGIVVDRDGRPVDSVLVQTWAASDAGIERASARLPTGADGRFALMGFGREAHVVTVFGSVGSLLEGNWVSEERPTPTWSVEGTRVTVAKDALRDVRIIVDRVEPTVVEMRGPQGRGYGVNDFPPQPVEPGVWVTFGGWGSSSFGERAASTLFVVVPEGTGCPWYVGRPADRSPFVLARKPGGLRVVTLTPARAVSGTLAADPRARHVRGFLRAPNGDRVEFGVVRANEGASEADGEGAVKLSPRTWKFVDAPSDTFDVAAYEGNVRRGPWVEVRAGTDAVEGLVVPVDAPPPSAPAAPADSPPPR